MNKSWHTEGKVKYKLKKNYLRIEISRIYKEFNY